MAAPTLAVCPCAAVSEQRSSARHGLPAGAPVLKAGRLLLGRKVLNPPAVGALVLAVGAAPEDEDARGNTKARSSHALPQQLHILGRDCQHALQTVMQLQLKQIIFRLLDFILNWGERGAMMGECY